MNFIETKIKKNLTFNIGESSPYKICPFEPDLISGTILIPFLAKFEIKLFHILAVAPILDKIQTKIIYLPEAARLDYTGRYVWSNFLIDMNFYMA